MNKKIMQTTGKNLSKSPENILGDNLGLKDIVKKEVDSGLENIFKAILRKQIY